MHRHPESRPHGRWDFGRIAKAGMILGGTVLAGLPVLSCSSITEEMCACTTEFRIFSVSVVDAQGQPATDVDYSVRRVSDGLDLTPESEFGLGQSGTYAILTDNALEHVTESGTLVEVTGTRGDFGFRAEFVFNTDACACHVSQVSGPGTVQLEPLP